MRFGGTLHHIIRRFLIADPRLFPVYLGKVDLSNAYMRLQVCLEDTPSVDFLPPNNRIEDKQLVGFHLSLPMGYVYSAPYFFIATETVTDIKNASMDGHHTAPPHPLEGDADTLAPDDCATEHAKNRDDLAQVDIYLDDFISTCQGGPQEWTWILCHLL